MGNKLEKMGRLNAILGSCDAILLPFEEKKRDTIEFWGEIEYCKLFKNSIQKKANITETSKFIVPQKIFMLAN